MPVMVFAGVAALLFAAMACLRAAWHRRRRSQSGGLLLMAGWAFVALAHAAAAAVFHDRGFVMAALLMTLAAGVWLALGAYGAGTAPGVEKARVSRRPGTRRRDGQGGSEPVERPAAGATSGTLLLAAVGLPLTGIVAVMAVTVGYLTIDAGPAQTGPDATAAALLAAPLVWSVLVIAVMVYGKPARALPALGLVAIVLAAGLGVLRV